MKFNLVFPTWMWHIYKFWNSASKVAELQVHATTPGAIQKQFKAVQTKLEQFKAAPTFTAI